MSNINTILVSVHQFLYPWRNLLFLASAIGLGIAAVYYVMAARNFDDRVKVIKKTMAPMLLCMAILPYSVLLNMQEPEVLSYLYFYVPLCAIPLPFFFLIYVVTAGFFTDMARKRE